MYESHRTIGAGQPVLGMTSTGFRTFPAVHTGAQRATTEPADEQLIEENYEVTLSANDDSGMKVLTSEPTTTALGADGEYVCCGRRLTRTSISLSLFHRFELDEEMYIACAIVNESLYDKNADKKKVVSTRFTKPSQVTGFLL